MSNSHRDAALWLDQLSWSEIARLQADGEELLLLPVGATEQHGPHLPINTDTVIASEVCAYASGACGVPLLPTLAYTVSAGHTAKWPGTFSLGHETFLHLMADLVSWVVATGWRRLMIVNSHFGNDASLRVSVDQMRLRYLDRLQIGVVNTFQLTPEIWKAFTVDGEDVHANKAETDLMLHLAPDTVHMDRVEDDPDRTAETVFSHPVARTSLNGVTGAPSEGNAEAGARLFAQMGEALAERLERARSEEAPLPEGEWLGVACPT